MFNPLFHLKRRRIIFQPLLTFIVVQIFCLLLSSSSSFLIQQQNKVDHVRTVTVTSSKSFSFYPKVTHKRTTTVSDRIYLSENANQQKRDDDNNVPSATYIHHVALKTRNITLALQFYSLLGYQEGVRFRAGPARAAWIYLVNTSSYVSRLEIIEVPPYMLMNNPNPTLQQQQEQEEQRAIDLMRRQDLLGYNHMALDVTNQIKSDSNVNITSLQDWIESLNRKSITQFGKSLRIALPPRQQMIGQAVYELAFLYDADGCLVELLHLKDYVNQSIYSGWEPWNGEGFVGQ